MNAIETYLKQLAFWLPAKKRESILEEVRGILLDRLDSAAQRNGQPLNEDQIKRELNDFGKPVVIAGQYMQQRPVISEALAFFYWKILSLTLLSVPVVQALAAAIPFLHGATTYAVDWSEVLAHTATGMLISFTSVTLVFICLDRYKDVKQPSL